MVRKAHQLWQKARNEGLSDAVLKGSNSMGRLDPAAQGVAGHSICTPCPWPEMTAGRGLPLCIGQKQPIQQIGIATT